ncbi:hypothetical protein A0U94_05520 [Gluconobacter albidus]|uniref:Uncharacterized protein n=1 Tax=Gluconobacter albidus TaxID=318683 RepID=A0AAW3QYI8_9PROT|nr:hypothetical protein A0U94_05520 [Gluconobacter albidus]KXV38491.1 hypothetical protein AD941_05725 [Gluconobacter albidus]OUI81159.1 hypothetical protein HK22_03535 [Gluconobacter sp. DsW_056]GBQ88204.1 hypothetical protein AA3250_1502 [Gluconobacter albidus NBRC 3250]GLQ69424.1 hypothetical protein GCM10007866_18750 [Gluconobacter albidus]
MFGSLIRITSGSAITDGLVAFHLTGSLLHVASTLLGHMFSGLSAALTSDAASSLEGNTHVSSGKT